MSGIFPASSVFNTRSALLTQVAVISFRYFELAAPSFFCSGIATVMFPASSTTWPMASRRASSPATRTADGPMSTPRRDCPRSSGTPITRIWRGVMLLKVVFRCGIFFLFFGWSMELVQLGRAGTTGAPPTMKDPLNLVAGFAQSYRHFQLLLAAEDCDFHGVSGAMPVHDLR